MIKNIASSDDNSDSDSSATVAGTVTVARVPCQTPFGDSTPARDPKLVSGWFLSTNEICSHI